MAKLPAGVRHSIWSLLDTVSYPVIYFAAVPVLIRAMGTALFGFWTVLTTVMVVLQLFNLNLGYTAMRHIAHERAKGNKQSVNDTINGLLKITLLQLIGIIIIGSITALIISMTGWPASYSGTIRYGALCFLLAAVLGGLRYFEQVFQNIVKSYERFRGAAILNMIFRTGTLGITLSISIFFPGKIVYVLCGNILFSFCYLIAHYVYLRRVIPFYKAAPASRPGLIHGLLGFSVWPWIQTILIVLTFQADRFWVTGYAGLKEVAAYGLIATMINHINIIFTAMVTWTAPRMIAMYARGENPETEYHFIRSLLTVITITALLIFYWTAPFIFTKWLGADSYEGLKPYIRGFTGFELAFVQTIMPFFYLNGTGKQRSATYATLLCCGVCYVLMLGGLWIFHSPVALVRGMTVGACLTVPVFNAVTNKFISGEAQLQKVLLDMIPVLAAIGLVYTSSPLLVAVLILAGGWALWKHYFIHLSNISVWRQVLSPERRRG